MVKVRLGYADAIRARFIVLVLVRLLRVVNVTRTKIGRMATATILLYGSHSARNFEPDNNFPPTSVLLRRVPLPFTAARRRYRVRFMSLICLDKMEHVVSFVGSASLVVSRGNDADQTPVSRRQQRWSRLLLLLLSRTTRFWKGRNSCRPHRRRNLRTPKVDETEWKNNSKRN